MEFEPLGSQSYFVSHLIYLGRLGLAARPLLEVWPWRLSSRHGLLSPGRACCGRAQALGRVASGGRGSRPRAQAPAVALGLAAPFLACSLPGSGENASLLHWQAILCHGAPGKPVCLSFKLLSGKTFNLLFKLGLIFSTTEATGLDVKLMKYEFFFLFLIQCEHQGLISLIRSQSLTVPSNARADQRSPEGPGEVSRALSLLALSSLVSCPVNTNSFGLHGYPSPLNSAKPRSPVGVLLPHHSLLTFAGQ